MPVPVDLAMPVIFCPKDPAYELNAGIITGVYPDGLTADIQTFQSHLHGMTSLANIKQVDAPAPGADLNYARGCYWVAPLYGSGTGGGPPYVLPIATDVILGGIKVGDGLAIDPTGILSTDRISLPYSGGGCTVPFTIPANARTTMSTWAETVSSGNPGVTYAPGSITLAGGRLYVALFSFEWSAALGSSGEVTCEVVENGTVIWTHMMDIGHFSFTGTYAYTGQFTFLTPAATPSVLEVVWNTTVAPPPIPVTLNKLQMLTVKVAEA